MLAIPAAVMAFLAGSFLLPGFAVTSVLAVVVVILHPAGRSVLQFDRLGSIDCWSAGILVVGAIPLLAYAVVELAKQVGPMDEHVLFVHYGAMAVASVFVVVMGTLAVSRHRDWRFAAWSSGLLAAYVGLASIAYPMSESSLGLIGGSLATLWAVAFVASVEHARERSVASGVKSLESGSPDDSGHRLGETHD